MRDLITGWQKGKLEGRVKGKLEGEAAVLERQLPKRFGPLDERTQKRLRSATLKALELWAERVLEAKRLEEVFGG